MIDIQLLRYSKEKKNDFHLEKYQIIWMTYRGTLSAVGMEDRWQRMRQNSSLELSHVFLLTLPSTDSTTLIENNLTSLCISFQTTTWLQQSSIRTIIREWGWPGYWSCHRLKVINYSSFPMTTSIYYNLVSAPYINFT